MANAYQPTAADKFTFGLWTVGNTGADPFGTDVREKQSPDDLVRLLGEVGAYGVNFHDNDLVPIDASAKERDQIVADFRDALDETGLVVPMATTDLFGDPAFRDGAFTSHDPEIRNYALAKTMRAMDLGAELGAETYVFWGGREGAETGAGQPPLDAIKRYREAMNYLCEYNADQGYGLRFALEPKPNEPRGNIFFPTVGAMLAFIQTLDQPEMVGVNPEVAHEHMSGLDFTHAVAQAWDAGKLFHIDLNDQAFGRFDQDYRFGSNDPKAAFFLVQFLEEVGYDGPRHFDAHAYRTSGWEDVKSFAEGCMRTYLILKAKAERFAKDDEIQALLQEINPNDTASAAASGYSAEGAQALKERPFDRDELGQRGQPYERLDQLTNELLLGVR